MEFLLSLAPRDTSDFDPEVYYRFYNNVRRNQTLNSGISRSTNGAIVMGTEETYSSSENWQIYPQGGRYFIRNYDYGAQYQLGLNKSSKSVPALVGRSGDLGQQWTLARNDDGTWKITNGLLGNGSALALTGGNLVPGMSPSDDGTSWTISSNPSAGKPPSSYQSDVADFVVASSSSASASQTTIPSSTTPSSTSTITPGLNGFTQKASINASYGISGGAIAGIVIGLILGLGLIALGGIFFMRRRKTNPYTLKVSSELPSTEKQAPSEMAGESNTVYQYRADEHNSPPVEIGSSGVIEAVQMPTPVHTTGK